MKIVDVINYEGGNNTLVWKSPHEDFNTLSQLIVHETQEALFFRDGQALDLFGPGRYTLSTQNIPLLGKFVNIPFDGVTPFHCEVYYFNKTEEMAIRWGTDSRVQYIDPEYGFPLSVGASGEMTIAVGDARKLLVKLVGTEAVLNQQKFMSYMRSIINQKVKPFLADVMASGAFSIFDVDAHLEELAEQLHTKLIPEFDDYGIELRRFMLLTVAKPVDDPNYHRIINLKTAQNLAVQERLAEQKLTLIDATTEAEAGRIQTVIGAEADAKAEALMGAGRAERRRQEGYTYQEERSFDVAQSVANNDAVGEFTNIGVGMGMIGGIGGSLSGSVAAMATDALSGVAPGVGNADVGFLGVAPVGGAAQGQPAGGAPAAEASAAAPADDLSSFKTRIQKLKIMHEEGLIDDAEFEAQKARIMGEI